MYTTPMLAVPNFNNTFVLEYDASGKGIRAVLMQEGHLLIFTSKKGIFWYSLDPNPPKGIMQLIQQLQVDPNPPKGYTWHHDTQTYKGHFVMEKDLALKQKVLEEICSSLIEGHSFFHKT